LGHRSALRADPFAALRACSAWWIAFALARRVVYASEKFAERALPFDHRAVAAFGQLITPVPSDTFCWMVSTTSFLVLAFSHQVLCGKRHFLS